MSRLIFESESELLGLRELLSNYFHLGIGNRIAAFDRFLFSSAELKKIKVHEVAKIILQLLICNLHFWLDLVLVLYELLICLFLL